uniref:NADH-ubiquinone oxidoreductase chain 6 n=1 Tax=Nothocercus nigrocapillus TaxID=1977171 RepID=A0A7G9TWQ1_9AVES|nr:NADH dehydrogenase subunit 6 [Nothocercus nigrocapillus]QNN84794.1 NADH dehydrogenase subunit 6 [Nothocercus nigrocapillus]
MTYFMLFLGMSFILGALAVASNPSPYYGVLGLVVGSVVGCGWLVSLGMSFISLALFLVYLGGMLVVFIYSVSLAADPYPEAWDSWRVLGNSMGLVTVVLAGVVLWGCTGFGFGGVSTVDGGGVVSIRLDFSGVAMFYSSGAGMFMVVGWGLLLTLFVVLELVRGVSWGAIRAV